LAPTPEGREMMNRIGVLLCGLLAAVTLNCGKEAVEVVELKKFPLDDLQGIVTRSSVVMDRDISSDGRGSLRITVTHPTVIRLLEVTDIDVENARLIYRASLRTENVEGKAYLDMRCHFPGRGEFFSKGIETGLTGTTDWVTEEISFLLKEGDNPDRVRLNLGIDGQGTVWIDDIRLLKAPLEQ